MDRTVNLGLLWGWLVTNGGVVELAHKSGVSYHTIKKTMNRHNPTAPRKRITQRLLAEAMGVEVDDLFPPIGSGEKKTG